MREKRQVIDFWRVCDVGNQQVGPAVGEFCLQRGVNSVLVEVIC